MTVNHEIKSQLAKLLATENFIVEHKDVRTASFNVKTRVLILPLWKLASNTVYDLLVSHECAHALFTPNEDWRDRAQVPQQFVNVVEDVRIEKLMKRKYPGLAKTFYHGYQELNDDDFFDIDDEDISTFNLADRINLHFKVGHFVDLAFSPSEEQVISVVEGCETFEDTLNAAKVLYEYCIEDEEKEEEKIEDKPKGKMDIPSVEEPEEDIEEVEEEIYENSEKPEIKTDTSLHENLEDLNDSQHHVDSVYCEIPEVILENVIISNTVIHKDLNDCFGYQFEDGYSSNEIDDEYYSFKKIAQKEVNYLVKEFECKKSADAYARTTVAKTGVLDCSKLHTYRFNEDLFKKVNIVPDGKNHGLIFLLDWSGSMADCLMDTIKQLYNLIWFCKKVQIPFEVYSFSDAYLRGSVDEKGEVVKSMVREENLLTVKDDFRLLNWITSKTNKATLENQLINLWRVAGFVSGRHYYYNKIRYMVLPEYNLGGTPLHEALISLYKIIPQFQKENGVQKVQCLVLTDGESSPLPVYRWTELRTDLEPTLRPRILRGERNFLRNRKTGHVYSIFNIGAYWEFTDTLLKDLREVFPHVNFIGMRLLNGRDFGNFIKRYDLSASEEKVKKSRKEKTILIKNSGYHSYFGMLSTGLYQDPGFEVAEDATKAQIKSAFVKSLKTKKLNKKVLGEFISLVA